MATRRTAGQWSGGEHADDQPSASALALAAKLTKSVTTPPPAVVVRFAAPKPAPVPAPTPEPAPAPATVPTLDPAAQDHRPRAYRLALQLSSQIFTVIELAEMERYFVRDRLEKLSMALPLQILTAMQCGTRQGPRVQGYEIAAYTARECASILDILGERGTIEPEPLVIARQTVTELLDALIDHVRYR